MSESYNVNNPYLNSDGSPRLEYSVVVFSDILGYTNFIMNGPEQESLLRFRSVVDRTYEYLRNSGGPLDSNERFYEIKTFSDNIIIGCPCSCDPEFELGYMLDGISFFQLHMALSQFFIRGAITLGNLYIDDNIVFGSGLIEAHREEENVARNPRIVLSDSVESHIQRHIRDYHFHPELYYNHIYRMIYCDPDGQYFLNYLEILLIDVTRPDYCGLLRHKDIVEAKLEEYRGNPDLCNKYVWVANYHNYFCIQNYRFFDESYRIALSTDPISFSRIV